MVFFVLVLLCVILLLLSYKIKYRNYWKKRNIVQINRNAWHFIFGNYSLSEVYKNIYDNNQTEDFVGTFIGFKPALILRNLEDIKAVLQSDFQSFHGRGYKINPRDDLAKNLLLIDDYPMWKLIRQKISPTFTSKKLKNMYSTLNRSASDFVQYIEKNPYIQENPFEALHVFTSASISASVFGVHPKTKNFMESPILDIGWKGADSLFIFNLKFAFANIFPKTNIFFNLKTFGSYKDLVLGVIKKVLKSRSDSKEKGNDFIDICLDLKRQGIMSDNITGYKLEPSLELLGAQAFSFFFAGVDTGANSMHFTLLELSNNTTILKKVHDELDEVFNKRKGSITLDDITNMEYLDMVVSESLRKYPPIGLMQRICTTDTILENTNIKIDKDTIVIIPIFGIHRDSKYFPNPDEFNPERFSAQNRAKIAKFSYLPFGEGNRICLGARFAHIQMKSGLAWLLRRYTLRGYNYKQDCFEPSFFGIRDSKARYDLIARNPT